MRQLSKISLRRWRVARFSRVGGPLASRGFVGVGGWAVQAGGVCIAPTRQKNTTLGVSLLRTLEVVIARVYVAILYDTTLDRYLYRYELMYGTGSIGGAACARDREQAENI